MCGIVGYIGENAGVEIFQSLKKLEYRGYDSAGIGVWDGFMGNITVRKSVGKLSDAVFISGLRGEKGIGHVRWATHGKPTFMNAHPHTDCSWQIAVVHNGIVENHLELKDKLKTHKFMSETDTEVIPHLIEHYINSGLGKHEAIKATANDIKGSYAFAVLINNEIYGMCRNMPLVFGCNGDRYIASDVYAIPNGCRIVYAENDRLYNLEDMDFSVAMINSSSYGTDNTSTHFMFKEIMEQPEIMLDVINQDLDYLWHVANLIKNSKHSIFTASGSSRYASLLGRYLLSSIGKCFSEVVMGSEFKYYADSLDKDSLVIAVSQSGETKDILDGVRVARDKGSKVVSIINRENSLLSRLSDYSIPMKCGAEISVPATKSFIAEVVICYMLAYGMVRKDISEGLKQVALELKNSIASYDAIAKAIAGEFKDKQSCYFIGRGSNLHIATEGALKLKETSCMHSEGMPAGELKHGTLALITDGTPVVAICPSDFTYNDTMSNIAEAKARGAYVIGVSDKPHSLFDNWFRLPEVEPIYYPILSIAPLQLLAYHTSVAKGYDPDHPRNLAKSVTVD